MSFPDGLPYLVAELTLLKHRRLGIKSGYRAHWRLLHPNGVESGNDGPVILMGFADEQWLQPGESCQVRIYPLAPEFWADIRVGTKIRMWEGSDKGTAILTKELSTED